jgi:hypothetical protein
VLRPVYRRWYDPRRYFQAAEEPISNVLEADEETGQVVCQVANARGELVWVNAAGDTVAVTDAVKVLLLNAETRAAFARAFHPKVIVNYVRGLRIELRSVTPTGFRPRVGPPTPREFPELTPTVVEGETVMLPQDSIY